MGAFPTGVGIVTTMDEHNQPQGLTSNALCSVSADPPLLLVCVDKNSNTLPALRHSKKFVVNYLSAGRGDLANLFASKEPDKFQNVSWRPGQQRHAVAAHRHDRPRRVHASPRRSTPAITWFSWARSRTASRRRPAPSR